MCKFVYAHQETKGLFLSILVHMCFLQLNYFIISIYFKKVHAWNNCQLESRNKNTVFDFYLNCICCTCIMIANQRPFCHLQVNVYHNRKVHVTGKFVRFFSPIKPHVYMCCAPEYLITGDLFLITPFGCYESRLLRNYKKMLLVLPF